MYLTQMTIEIEQVGDVWIAHLKSGSLDESWVERLGHELIALVEQEGCRKLVLQFAELDCLYSMLLGKLIQLRKVMHEHGGRIKFLGVSPLVKEVFRVCKLDEYFEFAANRDDALNDWE